MIRTPDCLRPVIIRRHHLSSVPGSVLYQAGETIVLCTAVIESGVPPWRVGSGAGWLTAEYSMLPASTRPRKPRERSGKMDGRTTEIQRLIGRSLRAAVDLKRLGENTLMIDCDVLQADGGTRTAAISGAYVAVHDAIQAALTAGQLAETPLIHAVAAISVGMIDNLIYLDLDYDLDSRAEVDMNVVQRGDGSLIEVQGTGEQGTFSRAQLDQLLDRAEVGLRQIFAIQQSAIAPQ